MHQLQLGGKTALVIGGGCGAGLGIALALAEAGAHVAVADADRGKAEEAASLVQQAGRLSMAFSVDTTNPDSVSAVIESVESILAPLDIAANNAGIGNVRSAGKRTAEDWLRTMAIAADGPILCTEAEVGVMRPRSAGCIINIVAVPGDTEIPDPSHFLASKFALTCFTNAVAEEVVADRITVNALYPGLTGTVTWREKRGLVGHWKQSCESTAESCIHHQKTVISQGVDRALMDVGQAAVYLAGAKHVTGRAIAVDDRFSFRDSIVPVRKPHGTGWAELGFASLQFETSM